MPAKFELTLNNLGLLISRVKLNAALIGGNEAWGNVVSKKARYRYVIDAATF